MSICSVHTVIVGAGQSGLALSYYLSRLDVEHVLLERGRVAERWRSERWDSLHFQFPNAFVKLPGFPYDGDKPDAFMHRDDIVARLQAYALNIDAPVRCGVVVQNIEREDEGEWRIRTQGLEYRAQNVVVATGPYQHPRIPPVAKRLPTRVRQLSANVYMGPDQLGAGPVLVVGSGASGGQIVDDILSAGGQAVLAVGRHRRFPRSRLGRDITYWLEDLGLLDRAAPDDPSVPFAHLLSGVGGGRDLNLTELQAAGLKLVGRLVDVTDSDYVFADTLAHDLGVGDQVYEYICALIDARHAGDVPPPPLTLSSVPAGAAGNASRMPIESFATVIWATGYVNDFSWIRSTAIQADGRPQHHRGVSNDAGLFFIGLPLLHKVRSSFLWGADADAKYLADAIAAR